MQKRRFSWFDLWIGLCILGVDQATKYWTLSRLSIGDSWLIAEAGPIACFCTLTTNLGAAWGVFAQYSQALLIGRVFFVLFLGGIYAFAEKTTSIRTALALVLSGACSNIIDVLYRGQVIDMIHLSFWGWSYPVFNVADVAICLGALYMVSRSLFQETL